MDKLGIRDVIQDMLDVEQQAQQVVSAAETEGQKLLIHARSEAERRVEHARRQAVEQSHAALQSAVEQAQRRRDDEVRRQIDQDAPIVAAARANIENGVNIIMREVAPGR